MFSRIYYFLSCSIPTGVKQYFVLVLKIGLLAFSILFTILKVVNKHVLVSLLHYYYYSSPVETPVLFASLTVIVLVWGFADSYRLVFYLL